MNGPDSRYKTKDGGYELMGWNTGICRFVWEHLTNVHRCLHIMKRFGGTFSGRKLYFIGLQLDILGHTVHYGGQSPDQTQVQKIADWPPCRMLTEVRTFLRTCGLVRIYMKNFLKLARPLVALTKKDTLFKWEPPQQTAMEAIKEAIIAAPALVPIRYNSNLEVILAVDSSYIAVGFILYQVNEEGKRKPSQFGSIT